VKNIEILTTLVTTNIQKMLVERTQYGLETVVVAISPRVRIPPSSLALALEVLL
jgi:hypothetical protein